MKYKTVTKKKAKEFYKDETMATKEYNSYGEKQLAADEARHAKYWKKRL